jgi:hypothetical protein
MASERMRDLSDTGGVVMAFHVPEAARVTRGPMGTTPNAGQFGAFVLPSVEPGWQLALICDDGTNTEVEESISWEHVSVRAYRGTQSRTPTWKEMAFVKDTCWDAEDVVVEYHPPKSEYVNAHPHVLHLWRNTRLPFPRPSPSLVGPVQ